MVAMEAGNAGTRGVGHTANHNNLAKLLRSVLALCEMDQALPKLLERVNKGQSIVDQQHSRAYSLSGEAKYGLRGGRPYFKPKSWLRYALYVKDFHLYKDWCVAYHGTTSQNLPSILLQGLQNPGEPGVSILHGQSYSQTKRTIYLSPSIEYAAFPVYAQLFSLAEASHWGQLVLQCRVRPDSFIERPGSLGNKYWPQHVRFDPHFNSLG